MKLAPYFAALVGGLILSTGAPMNLTISNAAAGEPEERLAAFMRQYQDDYTKMYQENSYAWWDAMTTGSEEAFAKSAEASLAMSP